MADQPYIGTIFAFAGNFAPRGYMLCQGQLLSIQQNAALFAILGTTYGGNGQTNFGLPNLQGRAPIGSSAQLPLGASGGTTTVTLTPANVPAHSHSLLASATTGNNADPSGAALAPTGDGQGGSYPSFLTGAGSTPNVAMNALSIGPNAGGSTPISVQNPYQTVTYIIATVGIFPSRN